MIEAIIGILHINKYMTVFVSHKNQAEHNEKLAKRLIITPYIDWAITCAFYSAIHYLEAKFVSMSHIQHTETLYEKSRPEMKEQDHHISTHSFREMLVGNEFPKIRMQYNQLRTSSEMVRYLDRTNDKTGYEFFSKTVAKQLIKDLETIKRFLNIGGDGEN